jgi:soluble lytic murein transglycosylase
MSRRYVSLHPVLVAFSLAVPTSAAETAAPAVPAANLSRAIRDGLSGLSFAEPERQDLVDQARAFIEFRRPRTAPKKKLLWIAECFKRPGENPFCDFMLERRAQARTEAAAREDTPEPRRDIARISDLLARGDSSELDGVRDTSLSRAMRFFPSWQGLAAVAIDATERRSCPNPALLIALGQKAEEFLPESQYRRIATTLYTRAVDCGEGELADKARYRLSLLHVWDGECRKAEPHLFALSEQKGGDYVSRALYWRVHCAKAGGNKLLHAVLKGRLLKEYPLSYHGLLLTQGPGTVNATASRLLDIREEPVVQFRSVTRPELNGPVRAAEALQSLKAGDLALEVLDSIEGKIDAAEIPFRLYVALLTGRSGDRIGKFKLLAGVFRDDPGAIGRGTLELFYPLQRFDVLQRHQANLDPYLVAALIRQESGFNERARSPAGAMGLMQLMPATARMMERVSRRELFDAKTNVRLGVKYFHRLLSRYDGDAELALAAYNAGPEKVDEWRRRYPTANRMLFFDLIPFRETREYVALIARNYYWYLNLYSPPPAERKKPAAKPLLFTLFHPL